jgi:hypothetical protein
VEGEFNVGRKTVMSSFSSLLVDVTFRLLSAVLSHVCNDSICIFFSQSNEQHAKEAEALRNIHT